MTLTTRRQFAQQTALAAAGQYAQPIQAVWGGRGILEARALSTPPLDAVIRKLASRIAGHVITM